MFESKCYCFHTLYVNGNSMHLLVIEISWKRNQCEWLSGLWCWFNQIFKLISFIFKYLCFIHLEIFSSTFFQIIPNTYHDWGNWFLFRTILNFQFKLDAIVTNCWIKKDNNQTLFCVASAELKRNPGVSKQ